MTNYENILIGSIIAETIAYTDISDKISVDMIRDERNKIIFSAIHAIDDSGDAVNLLSVKRKLQDLKAIDSVGGTAYIVSLMDNVVYGIGLKNVCECIIGQYVQEQMNKYVIEINEFNKNNSIDDTIDEAEKRLTNISEKLYNEQYISTISASVEDAIGEIIAQTNAVRENTRIGINTGLSQLNSKLNGGFRNGLYVLAARPAMGKTALSLHFAKNASEQGISVLFFSLEMTSVDLAKRLLQSYVEDKGEDYSYRFRNGLLTNEELVYIQERAKKISDNITIDEQSYVNISHIRSVARRLKRHGRCGMIIIDYLQLIDLRGEKNGNREQAIAQATRSLKLMSNELKVPILLLCQLNRASESRSDKKPSLSDLRESGAIEQDADAVMLIYRPAYYDINDYEGKSSDGLGVLIVAKHRAGATGDVLFSHDASLTTISDYSRQYTNDSFSDF